MENALINVPLEKYEAGVAAIARIEALKVFVVKNKYSIDREDIASILGFELPRPEKPILVDREF